jgi:hypothetical protein
MTESAKGVAAPVRLRRLLNVNCAVLAFLVQLSADVAGAEKSSPPHTGATTSSGDTTSDDGKRDPLSLDTGPLFVVVSIADQRASIYGGGKLLAQTPVSTGQRGHATPTGVFSIVQKRRWHNSNIYSNAPMPFMQRLTWSGIALHAGVVPGYPASHGCIRLPPRFAQRLFQATAVGSRVVVAPTRAVPFDIAHAALPAPRLTPVPAPDGPETAGMILEDTPQQGDRSVLQSASLEDTPIGDRRLNPIDFAQTMKAKAKADAKAAAQALRSATKLVGKQGIKRRLADRNLDKAEERVKNASRALVKAIRQFEDKRGSEAIAEAKEETVEAEVEWERVSKGKDAQIGAASEAVSRSARALSEAQHRAEQLALSRTLDTESQGEAVLDRAQTAGDIHIAKAKEAKAKAEANLARITKAEELRLAKATEARNLAEKILAQKVKSEQLRIVEAAASRGKAEAELADARRSVEEARAAKNAAQSELTVARQAVTEAKAAGHAAAKLLAEAERRLKPLSIFISRKTQRLYVRQDFEPLFDAPISVRDEGRSIGTHFYISTHARDDGAQLNWQAVSMPAGAALRPHSAKKPSSLTQDDGDHGPTLAPETAMGALDRVTISEQISQRLSELIWVGASIIISDNGISNETGSTTDFIILTK